MGDEGRHVKWDEAVIAEHDKLRGTRQKIDEPDTPFNRETYEAEAEQEGAGAGAKDVRPLLGENIKVMFNEGAAAGAKPKSSGLKKDAESKVASANNGMAGDGLDMNALQAKLNSVEKGGEDAKPIAAVLAKKDDFASKRKNHYNEYEMMMKWKQEHPDDEEDEDDEDE